MREWQSLKLVVLCCLVFCSACGCISNAPATHDWTITGSKVQDRLGGQLPEVKPMVAKYLGLPENAILVRTNTANPLSLEVARESGTHESFVLDERPRRLPPKEYSWYGELKFFVQRFGERECNAVCFYDASRERWLLDRICVAEPIVYEGKAARYWRPIDPSPDWKPTGGCSGDLDRAK